MKNIILATDFSDNARNSIEYAIHLFGDKNVKYTLINAFLEPLINKDILATIRDILEQRSTSGLRKDVDFINERFPDKELNIEQKSLYGLLPDVVNEISNENKFDFIVMGTKGKSGSWYIGSVAKSMIQHSTIPVFVIPEMANFKPISKIVYATDLVEDESFLIDQMVGFAKMHNAHITILHVEKDTSNSDWDIPKLKSIVEKTNYKHIMFEELIGRSTQDAIIDYTEKNDIDLLVLTTYTTLLLKRLFHRSLARDLLLNSSVPMLIYSRKNFDRIFIT